MSGPTSKACLAASALSLEPTMVMVSHLRGLAGGEPGSSPFTSTGDELPFTIPWPLFVSRSGNLICTLYCEVTFCTLTPLAPMMLR